MFAVNLRWDEQHLFCRRRRFYFIFFCFKCVTRRYMQIRLKPHTGFDDPVLSAFLPILEKSYRTAASAAYLLMTSCRGVFLHEPMREERRRPRGGAARLDFCCIPSAVYNKRDVPRREKTKQNPILLQVKKEIKIQASACLIDGNEASRHFGSQRD